MALGRCTALVAATCMAIASGCATMMHGSHQEISVTSDPPGARVRVTEVRFDRPPNRNRPNVLREKEMSVTGVTPCTLRLKRTPAMPPGAYALYIEKEQHEPQVVAVTGTYGTVEATATHLLAPTVIGTIIMVAVDFGTGSFGELDPDTVHVRLEPSAGDGNAP